MILTILALYNSLSTTPAHPAPLKEPTTNQAKQQWNGRFSTQKFTSGRTDKLRIAYIKKQIQRSLITLPSWHSNSLKRLEVHNDTNASRGLSSSSKMILHTNSIDSTDELRSVFIHEMGHIVDLGALKGTQGRRTNFKDGNKAILSDDPSLQFYQISWTSATKKKQETRSTDFVSGYATYDCFEDFAESYLLYRLHGEKFRTLKQSSPQLQKKYTFLKEHIFEGKEFNTHRITTQFKPGFDTTLLSLSN